MSESTIFVRRAFLPSTMILGACSDPTGPGVDREKGITAWITSRPSARAALVASGPGAVPTDGRVEVIQAPAQVVAGETFTAVITTIGLSGCWSADGASVELSPRLAEITPWDLVPTDPDLFCAGVLVALPRDVSLVFTEPGEAVIRVYGRRVVGGDVDASSDEIVERSVTVVAATGGD